MKTLDELQIELNQIFAYRADAESDFRKYVNSEDADDLGYAYEIKNSSLPDLDSRAEKIHDAVTEAGHGDQWEDMVVAAEQYVFDR